MPGTERSVAAPTQAPDCSSTGSLVVVGRRMKGLVARIPSPLGRIVPGLIIAAGQSGSAVQAHREDKGVGETPTETVT
jgi:hypothetical protein